MSKRNKFALVAKDIDSSDFKFVSCGSDKITKLEKIDLFTMQFKDKDEMIKYLLAKGEINTPNVDLFVVCGKRDGKEIKFFEPIYNSLNQSLVKCLEAVSMQFLKTDSCENSNTDKIFEVLETRLLNGGAFYDMVAFDETNLYGKFTDYIKKTKKTDGFMKKVKHKDGNWAYGSYPLIRNIVEAINRHDELMLTGSDVFVRNKENNKENKNRRGVIIPELVERFKSDHIDGQISLFDYLNENSNITIVEPVKKAVLVEKPRKTKVTKINWEEERIFCSDVSIDDKLIEIKDTLWNLPRSVFKNKSSENKTRVFNEEIFEYYDDEKKKKILNTALKSKILKLIDMSLVYRDAYKRALDYGENTGHVQNELRYYRETVMRTIKKDFELLDRVYIWCKTFNYCFDKNEEYIVNKNK